MIRYTPTDPGDWDFRVTSNIPSINGKTEKFTAPDSDSGGFLKAENMHAWAYAAAQDLGGRRITVNVVAPGYVADTELFGEAMTEARHAQLVAQTLVGRAGRPGDVAALCAYLVSADAGYLTAQVIQINGGALAG